MDLFAKFNKWDEDDMNIPPLAGALVEAYFGTSDEQLSKSITLFVDLSRIGFKNTICLTCLENSSIKDLKNQIYKKYKSFIPKTENWHIAHNKQDCQGNLKQNFIYDYSTLIACYPNYFQPILRLIGGGSNDREVRVSIHNHGDLIYRVQAETTTLVKCIINSVIEIIKFSEKKNPIKFPYLFYKQTLLNPEEQLGYQIDYNEFFTLVFYSTDRRYIWHQTQLDNMKYIHVKCDQQPIGTFKLIPDMLIYNIKQMILKECRIPINEQQLFYQGKTLSDSKSLENYQNLNQNFYNEIELVISYYLESQIVEDKNLLCLQFINSSTSFKFTIKKNKLIKDLKNLLKLLLDNTWYFKEPSTFFCNGRLLTNEEDNESLTTAPNNSTITLVDSETGWNCLILMREIRNLSIENLTHMISSLNFINQVALNQFIQIAVENINTNKVKRNIYQQFQLHHLIAIQLWTSNLLYQQINIDIRNCDYDKWTQYLKYLLDGLRFCSYFKGKAFRGIKNYQNTQLYREQAKLQWHGLSSVSKNKTKALNFSNQNGMIFELELFSAKDISQLSVFPSEEEIILLPYQSLQVQEIQISANKQIVVKLRELPYPRQTKIVMWVDDNLENNYGIAQQLESENKLIQVIFCPATQVAISLLKDYEWMMLMDDTCFRIVTNMVRTENGKPNYFAGIDLLKYLYEESKLKNKALIFCGDSQKAKENCKKSNINGPYVVSQDYNYLKQFIRFV